MWTPILPAPFISRMLWPVTTLGRRCPPSPTGTGGHSSQNGRQGEDGENRHPEAKEEGNQCD